MKKCTALGAATVLTLALSPLSTVVAANLVVDSSGNNVFNSSGVCVNDTGYTDADLTVACGAEPPKVEAAPAPVAKAAPAPAPVAPAPVAPTIESVDISGSALFALDSSKLSSEGKASLDSVIEQLRGFDKVKTITVTGHTDSTGSAAYNQKLSEKRAQTVVNYFVSKGVNPALLAAVGAGETAPVADNATKSGRAENRRVAIDIAGSKVSG